MGVVGEEKGFAGVDVLGTDFCLLHGVEGKLYYNLGKAELVFVDKTLRAERGVLYQPDGISAAEYI